MRAAHGQVRLRDARGNHRDVSGGGDDATRSRGKAATRVVIRRREREKEEISEGRVRVPPGQSMGGLLSLGVARRPDLVDRLVLVNPASSFDRSPWPSVGPLLPSLPEEMYGGVPYALAPVLFEPAALITGGLDAVAKAARRRGSRTARSGCRFPTWARSYRTASAARTRLAIHRRARRRAGVAVSDARSADRGHPRDTLAHRLSVLAAECEGSTRRHASVHRRPRALRRELGDLLIPSGDEGPRPAGRCRGAGSGSGGRCTQRSRRTSATFSR